MKCIDVLALELENDPVKQFICGFIHCDTVGKKPIKNIAFMCERAFRYFIALALVKSNLKKASSNTFNEFFKFLSIKIL